MSRRSIAYLVTGLVLLAAHEVRADPRLRCVVSAPHPWLGNVVTWQVRRDGAGPPLSGIDPTRLGPDWYVAYQSESQWTDSHGTASASDDISLYPMRAGNLALPAVHVGGLSCPVRKLTIASHAPGRPGVSVTTRLSLAHPYSGQAIRLSMDIAYPGDLTWDAVTLDSRHAEIRPIEIAYGRQTDRGAIMNVRHFAWTILPLTPGPLTLRFGRLTARHAGPIEIIPAPPPVRIDVRAVPGFMPADSVIGRPAATILYASHRLNVGQTGLLSLQLSGIGLIRPMVAAVFDPPPKSPGLRFDPPLIRRMLTSNDSLTNVWRIDLTFRTMHAGHVVYPRLRISYFDPMDGVPRAIFVRPRSLRIADPMRRRIELAIAVSVVIFLSGVIGWFGVRAVRREILIARARARLRDARTAVQARDILLSWPFAPKSATLRKWLNCVAPADPAITAVTAQIERELYSRGGSNQLTQIQAQSLADRIE